MESAQILESGPRSPNIAQLIAKEQSSELIRADLNFRIKQLKTKFPKIFNCAQSSTINLPSKKRYTSEKENANISKNEDVSSSSANSESDLNSGSTGKSKRNINHDKLERCERPECEGLQLTGENLLIIDLLGMSNDERSNYLVELALKQKILMKNPNTNLLDFNPLIAKFRSTFLLTRNAEYVNTYYKSCPQLIREKKTKETFENYVNSIINDDTAIFSNLYSDDEAPTNYYDTDEYNIHLEKYAEKCVENNLGVIIEGTIRVNAKNNTLAFIPYDNDENDAVVTSLIGRKLSLHGDIVKAFVRITNDKEKKVESETKTVALGETDGKRNFKAFVIKIIEKLHPRKCIGYLLKSKKNSKYLKFQARDPKIPHILVHEDNLPKKKSGKVKTITPQTICLLEIIETDDQKYIGKIIEILGQTGNLEFDNKAIILDNNLDVTPYDDKFQQMYEGVLEIPKTEFDKRQDIRSECIFTIDPATAKDLDDAMSCKKISSETFEVGVHISDVTYFLQENSELDSLVKNRATSVYMVNEVFHMLPQSLCFKCSLLPGEDKFAFSVFWILNQSAEILETRFVKTIINSCSQFAYEHAQKIIDGSATKLDNFPEIYNGYGLADISQRILQLQSLAVKLRKKRFDNGSLKIDRPKLCFELDSKKSEPTSYSVYESKEANFLIEEFMLLANQSVAKFIYSKFPKISILRHHFPPKPTVINTVKEYLSTVGVSLDTNSSKSIHESIEKAVREHNNSKAVSVCLSFLISKALSRASYFCSDNVPIDQFWHHALSIPFYTHFTSPIRRYADILVHRVLNAAIRYSEVPIRTPAELKVLAKISNKKKYDAKLAGDSSCELYFLHYLKMVKQITMQAAVLEVFPRSFDVILIKTGHQISIKFSDCGKNIETQIFNKEKPYTAILVFPKETHNEPLEIKAFSELWVEVSVVKDKLKATIFLNNT